MRRMPDQAHSVPNISVLRSYMCMPTLARNDQCTKIASKRAFWDRAQVNQMLLTVTSNRNITIITPNLLRAELIRRNINMTFYLVLSLYVKACLSLKFIFNVWSQWRHMSVTGLSSHQQLDYFFFTACQAKKNIYHYSILLALCEGNPLVTGGFPHKVPVTRKAFPCQDVIMDDSNMLNVQTLIARFMGPTLGSPGDDRTQVGPMLATWTLLLGKSISRQLLTWRDQGPDSI